MHNQMLQTFLFDIIFLEFSIFFLFFWKKVRHTNTPIYLAVHLVSSSWAKQTKIEVEKRREKNNKKNRQLSVNTVYNCARRLKDFMPTFCCRIFFPRFGFLGLLARLLFSFFFVSCQCDKVTRQRANEYFFYIHLHMVVFL